MTNGSKTPPNGKVLPITEAAAKLCELALVNVKAIVTAPDAVRVEHQIAFEERVILRCHVHRQDLKYLIGGQGDNIKALRVVLTAASRRLGIYRFDFDVPKDTQPPPPR